MTQAEREREMLPLTEGDLRRLTPEEIQTVYLGRSDRCYCGCAGSYVYNEHNPPDYSWQGKVNDSAQAKRVERMIQKLKSRDLRKAYLFRGLNQWIMTVDFADNRALTLYTKDETTLEEWAAIQAKLNEPTGRGVLPEVKPNA